MVHVHVADAEILFCISVVWILLLVWTHFLILRKLALNSLLTCFIRISYAGQIGPWWWLYPLPTFRKRSREPFLLCVGGMLILPSFFRSFEVVYMRNILARYRHSKFLNDYILVDRYLPQTSLKCNEKEHSELASTVLTNPMIWF